jgi:hypothetical protein
VERVLDGDDALRRRRSGSTSTAAWRSSTAAPSAGTRT